MALQALYNDVSFCDRYNHKDVSFCGFGAKQKVSFSENEASAFSKFLKKFSFMGQAHTPLEPHPLWMGYFSFESLYLNPSLSIKPGPLPSYPLAAFRFYKNFIWQKSPHSALYFISFDKKASLFFKDFENKLRCVNKTPKTTFNQRLLLKSRLSFGAFEKIFKRIQKSLRQGQYYEINFTRLFSAKAKLTSLQFLKIYLALRSVAKAPHMHYLGWPELKVASASPELFFKLNPDGFIYTKPIKGTRPRSQNKSADLKTARALWHSEKDAAELLMITDLTRNDFHKVCEVGQVKTPKIKALHSYSHTHHLYSKITGQLKKNINLFDVFCALFPAGSITGAPKLEVIKNIQNLEKRPRGVYTGALGYLSQKGFCAFNLAIRTLTYHENKLAYNAGGGIVLDSTALVEYNEADVKARVLGKALKNLNCSM